MNYTSLTGSLLKDIACAIIVTDLSKKKTFVSIDEWINLVTLYSKNQYLIIILVGNKNDLENNRETSQEEVKKLQEKYNLPYFEVSAKTGEQI